MDDPASVLPVPLPGFVGEWVKPADLREMPSDSFEVTPGVWLRMVPHLATPRDRRSSSGRARSIYG